MRKLRLRKDWGPSQDLTLSKWQSWDPRTRISIHHLVCATSHKGKGTRPVPKDVSKKEPGLPASGVLVFEKNAPLFCYQGLNALQSGWKTLSAV